MVYILYSFYTAYEPLKNWDVFLSGEFGTINATDEVGNLRVSGEREVQRYGLDVSHRWYSTITVHSICIIYIFLFG